MTAVWEGRLDPVGQPAVSAKSTDALEPWPARRVTGYIAPIPLPQRRLDPRTEMGVWIACAVFLALGALAAAVLNR